MLHESAPLQLRPLVCEKLDEWLNRKDIITPVEEPTDWVSSLAYSHKAQWQTMDSVWTPRI